MLDYKAVCAWLNREGLLAQLCIANSYWLPADAARALAHEIIGPQARVLIKRTRRSWAHHIPNGRITLACRPTDRAVNLSSILHECAHVLDYRKGRKLGYSAHGEPFRRTYARLLREYTVSNLPASLRGNSAPSIERI